jgi:hypothetical protein
MRLDTRIKKLEVLFQHEEQVEDSFNNYDLSKLNDIELELIDSCTQKSNKWKNLNELSLDEIKELLKILDKTDGLTDINH